MHDVAYYDSVILCYISQYCRVPIDTGKPEGTKIEWSQKVHEIFMNSWGQGQQIIDSCGHSSILSTNIAS